MAFSTGGGGGDCFSGERAMGGFTTGGLGAGFRSEDSTCLDRFITSTGRGGGVIGMAGKAGTRTSPWHLGQRKVCPARLSETIRECPEGHLIRSGIARPAMKKSGWHAHGFAWACSLNAPPHQSILTAFPSW